MRYEPITESISADAADKNEDDDNRKTDPEEVRDGYATNPSSSSSPRGNNHVEDDGCTWLKFRIWMQLSQELVMIFGVAFLLIICLPTLAFWSMFLGIVVSVFNIYVMLKRLWREAHSSLGTSDSALFSSDDEIFDASVASGEDMEFQEFLSNFGDRDT
ncbi:MAG: hypothetical protein SGILL_005688 [Bacillariaceae sp.]